VLELDGVAVAAAELPTASLGLTNYGHFTTVRLDDGGIKGWRWHLERLVRDSRLLFDRELEPDLVRQLTRQMADRAPVGACLRITIFDSDLDLATVRGTRQRILLSLRPGVSLRTALHLTTAAYQRDLPQVKHTGLIGALYQRRLAQQAGYDDACFVTLAGLLSEGPTWNIGLIRAGELVWPQARNLAGVAQQLVTELAADAGIRVVSEPISAASLTATDGCFITNSLLGLRPVCSMNDVPLRGGEKIIRLLQRHYDELAPESI
jgi:branched-subunit amino acid aminotransferase/4-amino-4-deoxychorismate lyase